MKKTLMTVITVGALAIPVGVLVAEADPIEPADDSVPTTVQPERERDRERRHVEDPAVLGERRPEWAGDCPVDATPARQREQIRVAEGTGEGHQAHERDQVRVAEDSDDDVTQMPADDPGETDDDPGETDDDPGETDDGANLQFRYGSGRGAANR
mgnify:CR=1 FL=1